MIRKAFVIHITTMYNNCHGISVLLNEQTSLCLFCSIRQLVINLNLIIIIIDNHQNELYKTKIKPEFLGG